MADFKPSFDSSGGSFAVEMQGAPTFQAQMGEVQAVYSGSAQRIGEVFLSSAAWQICPEGFRQVVSVVPIAGAGVTAKSQVDLTPDPAQVAIFCEKYLTFTTRNRGGVVTAYAIGQRPANDYTMQVTLSEVAADGDIMGVTVGTPTSIARIKEELDLDEKLLTDEEVDRLLADLQEGES